MVYETNIDKSARHDFDGAGGCLRFGFIHCFDGSEFYALSAKNSAYTHSIAQFIDRETLGITAMTEQLRLAGIGIIDMPAVLVHKEQLLGISSSQSINLNHQLSQTGGLPSHYPKSSDQLTIHYIAPADMWDCEGSVVLGPRPARLKMVRWLW